MSRFDSIKLRKHSFYTIFVMIRKFQSQWIVTISRFQICIHQPLKASITNFWVYDFFRKILFFFLKQTLSSRFYLRIFLIFGKNYFAKVFAALIMGKQKDENKYERVSVRSWFQIKFFFVLNHKSMAKKRLEIDSTWTV